MKSLKLKAPAKVNFRLDVMGRRPNGYHDLRMIMQRIDLNDEITIALTETPGVRVTCGRKGVPDGPDNIAWRAADSLVKLSGRAVGIDIAITKNIPVAAGLGGGSSDAATVLMGVNDLLGLGLSREKLMEIGVTLGADVPFFIFERPALAEGIGECLTPLEGIPPVWLVLVNPNVHVSTAWVYQNLQLTTEKVGSTIPLFYRSTAEVCAVLSNDLETVTIPRFPVIREIKDRLLAAGAAGALMSGSGPTVFGVFAEEETARRACAAIKNEADWFAAVMQ
ncbi:MAG TPA: 4-(cytidine 5'-diphospho)-2-C-methyl-D-erythritol kinase, partial [Geobacteraceae bacterium]